MNKKWGIALAGVVVAAFAVGGVVWIARSLPWSNALTNALPGKQIEEGLTQGLVEAAADINKKAPTMVDDTTRLDRAEASAGARMAYFYTLPNFAAADLEKSVFQSSQKAALIKNICSNIAMKPSIELGAVFIFHYKSSDGVDLASIEISKKDCHSH
ncbi:hypothetical protein [Parachitinimonas caeni]|nr:hypothetical protein [Parachitinimonas caeni]